MKEPLRHIVSALVLLLAACAPHAHDQDYAKMNTMPLSTYCVGRLLVGLPEKAIPSWTQEFDKAQVSRLDHSIQSQQDFWNLVEKRRKELAGLPHETEGSQLSLYEPVGGTAAVLLFRDSATFTGGYMMERYLWIGTRGYLLRSGPWPNSLKDQIQENSQIFSRLSPIDNRSPPQQRGFCIDGALITGDMERISVSPAIDAVPGMQGVWLTVGTGETTDPQTSSTGSAFDDLSEEQRRIRETASTVPDWVRDPLYPKEFTVLRKRERSLNGIAGQEVAYRKTFNNGKHEYRFRWQIQGADIVATKHSGLSLEMGFTDEQDSNKPGIPPPPEDQMYALWDAVLNSVQIRQGGV